MFKQEYTAKSDLVDWCKKNNIDVNDNVAQQAVLARRDSWNNEALTESIYSTTLLRWLMMDNSKIFTLQGNLNVFWESAELDANGERIRFNSERVAPQGAVKYCEVYTFTRQNILQNQLEDKAILKNYCIVVDREKNTMTFICLLSDVQADKEKLEKLKSSAEEKHNAVVKDNADNAAMIDKYKAKEKELALQLAETYNRVAQLETALKDFDGVKPAESKKFKFPWE